MRRTVVVAAATLALALAPPVASQAAVVTNVQEPIDTFLGIPCANGGAGEVVHVTGTLHSLSSITMDGRGGIHGTDHFQPQGVSGVGLTTGATYRATWLLSGTFNFDLDDAPEELTAFNDLRLIGQGRADNYLVHSVLHLTINANGVVTVDSFKFSAECK